VVQEEQVEGLAMMWGALVLVLAVASSAAIENYDYDDGTNTSNEIIVTDDRSEEVDSTEVENKKTSEGTTGKGEGLEEDGENGEVESEEKGKIGSKEEDEANSTEVNERLSDKEGEEESKEENGEDNGEEGEKKDEDGVTHWLEVVEGEVCSKCTCYTSTSSTPMVSVVCPAPSLPCLSSWPPVHTALPTNTTLLTINLSHNCLTSLPRLKQLNVASLDLSSNSLDSLAALQFSNLSSSLLILNLSGNQLTPTGLSPLALHQDPEAQAVAPWRLQVLSLADNRLHSIPAPLFAQLGNLEALDLGGNPLGPDMDPSTTQAIGGLASLSSLVLASCGLTSLPPALLPGLTLLSSLDLSGNPLTVVDPSLALAPSLTSLLLDRTSILVLEEDSFLGLEDLRNLSISRSALREVGAGSLAPLAQLEELVLSENQELSFIHPDAWRPAPSPLLPLKVLQLSNNSLKYLPSMLFDTAEWLEIEEVGLGGNPWECDCHNLWILTLLLPAIQEASVGQGRDMICHGPAGTPFVKMSMVEVMGLSTNHSSVLPCGTAQFDPYRRSFFKQELEHRKVQAHGAPLAGGVAAVCVAAVLATALLVTVLHRQKRSRGGQLLRFPRAGRAPHVAYTPTEALTGVRCSAGTGIVNPEYRDTEQEMADMAARGPYSRPSMKVVDWPGPPED